MEVESTIQLFRNFDKMLASLNTRLLPRASNSDKLHGIKLG